jgi:hypothetical protein
MILNYFSLAVVLKAMRVWRLHAMVCAPEESD